MVVKNCVKNFCEKKNWTPSRTKRSKIFHEILHAVLHNHSHAVLHNRSHDVLHDVLHNLGGYLFRFLRAIFLHASFPRQL